MTPRAPELPPELEPIRRLPPGDPGDALELSGALVEAEAPVRARRVRIRECDLRGLTFDAGAATELDLVDVVLADCDLSNVDARGGHLRRVTVRRSRLIGWQLDGGQIRDATIADSTLALASLASAGLQDVVFDAVDLTDATFAQARLRNVHFVDCTLAGAEFRGARLTECAMRGCSLDGVTGVEALRGLTMPWPDVVASAGALAAALGIKVED